MEMLQSILFGDTPWLADVVYPLLAGACVMVSVLSFSWYYLPASVRMTARKPHDLHWYIGLVSATMVFPALVASAGTGHLPSYDIMSLRNMLRLSWLMVTVSLFSVVIYYVRRLIALAVVKKNLADRVRQIDVLYRSMSSGD